MEDGKERTQGSQNGEGSCELPSSGHGMDVVLMSSLKLWLSTEGKVNSISQHQLASTGSCRLHEEKGGSVKGVPNVLRVPRKRVGGAEKRDQDTLFTGIKLSRNKEKMLYLRWAMPWERGDLLGRGNRIQCYKGRRGRMRQER